MVRLAQTHTCPNTPQPIQYKPTMSYSNFALTEDQEITGNHLKQIQNAIHSQLTVIQDGVEADSELAEFVTVMLNNQKTLGEMGEQIGELLTVEDTKMASASTKFCSWLKTYLVNDGKKKKKDHHDVHHEDG